jgi:Rod binding domain-containing protein
MTDLTPSIPLSMPTSHHASATPQDPLRKAAMQLEATFLAEMLKSAGLGESRESFGGGSGEDQFSTFLIRAQAEQMAQAGGIGLAESLYHSLKEAQND